MSLCSCVDVHTTVEMLLVQLITEVEVPVTMHWHLRSQAGAFCKHVTQSVTLATLAGCTLVLFVMLQAPRTCWCNSSRWWTSWWLFFWAINCAQVLSAKLVDDDCLVVCAVGAGLARSLSGRTHSTCFAPLGTMLTAPQDAGLALFASWDTDVVTEEKVDTHLQINQRRASRGRAALRLETALPRRSLAKRKHGRVKEVVFCMNLPPLQVVGVNWWDFDESTTSAFTNARLQC